MARRLLVKIEEDAGTGAVIDAEINGGYSWQFQSVEDTDDDTGGKVYWGDLEALADAVADEDVELWLLVPGSRMVTQHLEVSRKEQRHLRQLAPYQLEDELAGEIEDTHFAFGDVVDDQVPIVCVDKSWLRGHFQAMNTVGLEVNRCLPDTLLLPRESDGWTLRLGQELQICRGVGDGFAVADALAPMALAALVQGEGEGEEVPLPQTLSLLAESDEKLARLESLLPPVLAERVVERSLSRAWDLDWSLRDCIDLCQGDFARHLPFQRWWQQWRRVGMMAAAVFAAFVIVNVAELQSLKNQQQQLRKAMETVYRQVIPKGAMVDPEKQLARRAKSRQNVESRSQLMPMLASVSPIVAAADGVSLKAMNYSDDKQELRLNIQAPTFNTIEKLRSDLNKNGLVATLINASASGNQHQARLRVERR